jgi:hypothetical protein
MIIPDNISVTDFTITKTGSMDNLISTIESEGFSGLTADISGIDVESFWDNTYAYSNNLRLDQGKIVSLKVDVSEIDLTGHAYDEGFDESYDSPD